MKKALLAILGGLLFGLAIVKAFPPKTEEITVPNQKLPCSSMIDSRCENYQPQMCHE